MVHRIPLLFAAALLLAAPASAAPSLDEVIEGDVTFHQDGSITVITASDGAIIHYDSFDVFVDEVVRFVQPGETAKVLNRVFGDMTRIEGEVTGNGIVYIVNPAGIFIDGRAVVEVGGLVAAAGRISDEDFRAGIDRFELTGAVENHSRDVRAGDVALLGQHVSNFGEIHAPGGTIALVAGDRVVLTRLGGRVFVEVDGPLEAVAGPGVVQAGTVDAGSGQAVFAVGDHYSMAINHDGITRGGDVRLRGGDDGTILVQGEIDATGEAQGGTIEVIGERVALLGATLDASGETGGGSIHVGGRLRGEGDSARRTFVDGASVLRADATSRGDGGEVVVWGDEAAVFQGLLSARGGAAGGDGGFAEISSLGLLRASGHVDLGAPAGVSGTLLFDPQDIVIQGGTLDGDDTPDTSDAVLDPAEILFDDDLGADPFVVYESEIESTDANIVLEARHSITTAGTFDHEQDAEGEGVVVMMPERDLTLRTRNAEGDDAGSAMAAGIDLGDVDFRTSEGDITIESGTADAGIDAGITAGDLMSGGGEIRAIASTGDVSVGDVDASGADGGDGGDAGGVQIGNTTAGDVIVGAVDTTGGDGATGAGGNGGPIEVISADGSVVTGSLDASGGDGATDGGNGGTIRVIVNDVDASGTSSILVDGDIRTRGGTGAGGDGGRGDGIGLRSNATPADPTSDDPPMGGGPITVLGSLDVSGGDGTADGGAGGTVQVFGFVSGDVSLGDVTARSGDADMDGVGGAENGGEGGRIFIDSDMGSITAGVLDTSGGDGSLDGMGDAEGEGGGARIIQVRAGLQGSGDATLGQVVAVDGAGTNFSAPADATRVHLQAAGDVGFSGVAMGDPHIQTTENVELRAGASLNGGSPVRIDAVDVLTPPAPAVEEGEPPPPEPLPSLRTLAVEAGGAADVDVTNAGFTQFELFATSAGADIAVSQVAADAGGSDIEILVDGDMGSGTSTVSANTLDPSLRGGAALEIALLDILEGDDDTHLVLSVPDQAIDAGGDLTLISEDDVVLGERAIEVTQPESPALPADVGIGADADADGDGAIVTSAAGPHIDLDMNDDANAVGILDLLAGGGIGSDATPLRLEDAGEISAGVTTSGGIHVVQTQGGDLALLAGRLGAGFASTDAVAILAGDGEIDVENQAGDLVLLGGVRAAGDDGAGGSVRLAATGPDAEIRVVAPGGATVGAAGDALLEGPVVLGADATVDAGGDVTFTGAIDSLDPVTRNLTVRSEDGIVRFQGDVGAGFLLRNLAVEGDTLLDPSTGSAMGFTALQTIDFGGGVNATGDDATSLSLTAGDGAHFGGNVGDTGRVTGLSVDAPTITFDGDGAQTVLAGAEGIAFNAPDGLPAPPQLANVGKAGGDLRLESAGGDVAFGPNQKLTVEGVAEIVGDTVSLGDANALELHVDAASAFLVHAREPGTFVSAGGDAVPDGGTDLFANVITTTAAPEAVGDGPTPQIFTRSGAVGGAGAGALPVAALTREIVSEDLVEVTPDRVIFFDVGVAISDPGNEVEPEPPPVAPLLPARPGDEPAAGSAGPPSAETVLAFLRCADASPEAARACAPSEGSPLDSERGEELAAGYRRLFGSGPEAEAAQRLLRGDGAERAALLRDLATFLAQLRLSGMEEAEYERLRDRLLGEAVGPERLETALSDVRDHARGLPL